MRYLRTFLRHWYLYLVPVIIIPIVVTAYGYKALLAYQSRALLWVDKPVYLSAQDFGWSNWATPAQNEASAMTELLQSETFVVNIAGKTNLATALDLKAQSGKDSAFYRIGSEISIFPTGVGPHTLVVSVTDKDPALALQILNATLTEFTSQYQANRLQLDQQGIAYYQQLSATTSGLVTQDVQKVQEYLAAHPGVTAANNTDPTLAQLETQLQQDQQTLNSQNSQIEGLRQDMLATNEASPDIFHVTNPPTLPTSPTISKKSLIISYTGGGLGAALALDGLIILALTQLDRKVYSKADLQLIADDLELEFPTIEALPVIAGIGRGMHTSAGSVNGGVAGILLPTLTAVPRLDGPAMGHEFDQATARRDQR